MHQKGTAGLCNEYNKFTAADLKKKEAEYKVNRRRTSWRDLVRAAFRNRQVCGFPDELSESGSTGGNHAAAIDGAVLR